MKWLVYNLKSIIYRFRGGSLYDEASGESEAEGLETNAEGLALPEREKIMVESILAWRWPLSEDEKAADRCGFAYGIDCGRATRDVPDLFGRRVLAVECSPVTRSS